MKENICLFCGKVINQKNKYYNKKFCNNSCCSSYYRSMKSIYFCLYCKECGKEILVTKSGINKQFCSQQCHGKYFIKHGLHIWQSLKFQIEMGKRAAIKNKKNKISLGFDKELQKKIHIQNKKLKKGYFNPEIQSKGGKIGGPKGVAMQIKNKIGYFNPEIRMKAQQAARKALRFNVRNLKYKNNYYDSKPEIEFSLNLQCQFNYKPIEKKTLHIQIKKYEYDYLLKDLKLFVEFHCITFRQHETILQYKNKRFKNLKENYHKDYNLEVITW